MLRCLNSKQELSRPRMLEYIEHAIFVQLWSILKVLPLSPGIFTNRYPCYLLSTLSAPCFRILLYSRVRVSFQLTRCSRLKYPTYALIPGHISLNSAHSKTRGSSRLRLSITHASKPYLAGTFVFQMSPFGKHKTSIFKRFIPDTGPGSWWWWEHPTLCDLIDAAPSRARSVDQPGIWFDFYNYSLSSRTLLEKNSFYTAGTAWIFLREVFFAGFLSATRAEKPLAAWISDIFVNCLTICPL